MAIGTVITSYSIHYTKLYEERLMVRLSILREEAVFGQVHKKEGLEL